MGLPPQPEANSESVTPRGTIPGFSSEARRNFCKLDWKRKLKIVLAVGISVTGCVLDFGLAFSGKWAGWALLCTATVFGLTYFLVQKEARRDKPSGPMEL